MVTAAVTFSAFAPDPGLRQPKFHHAFQMAVAVVPKRANGASDRPRRGAVLAFA
jgi:hypothetical protein